MKNIIKFYGDDPQNSNDYGKIIRNDHFDKLVEMIQDENIVHGGDHNLETRYIAPTLINEPKPDSKIMKGEIFGPMLPIISYETKSDLKSWIDRYEKPLGAYVFANANKFEFLNWF